MSKRVENQQPTSGNCNKGRWGFYLIADLAFVRILVCSKIIITSTMMFLLFDKNGSDDLIPITSPHGQLLINPSSDIITDSSVAANDYYIHLPLVNLDNPYGSTNSSRWFSTERNDCHVPGVSLSVIVYSPSGWLMQTRSIFPCGQPHIRISVALTERWWDRIKLHSLSCCLLCKHHGIFHGGLASLKSSSENRNWHSLNQRRCQNEFGAQLCGVSLFSRQYNAFIAKQFSRVRLYVSFCVA